MLQNQSGKLNELQLSLMKSFAFITDKDEVMEIDSLINYYLEQKLDRAIESVESERGYTAKIYDLWLAENTKNADR